jgi:hypothetical protein
MKTGKTAQVWSGEDPFALSWRDSPAERQIASSGGEVAEKGRTPPRRIQVCVCEPVGDGEICHSTILDVSATSASGLRPRESASPPAGTVKV